jgi:hypothetical protein
MFYLLLCVSLCCSAYGQTNVVQDEAASTSPDNGAQSNDPTVDYTISAAVAGLTGSGLVLQDNGGSNLSVPSNGTYTFSTEIPAGGSYDVTVLTQPSDQTCTVAKHKGTANSNVTVTVTCVATYSISAAVSGLTGTKQGLALKNNGEDKLTISGNGTFTFSSRYKAGKTYDVTVSTQPAGETCTVANPTGTLESDVTVTVTCAAPTYTISASVTGLTGTGLVLQDNGASNLSIPSNGTYTFSTKINAGGTYDVTVLTQPTGQTCTVTNPTGTANSNVTVTVTCVAITYTISASVTGLTGTGLVLQDNGGSNLSIPSNGTYSFSTKINAGGSYDVTVLTQPTGQTCTVTNPTGTANSNVTVTVTCVAITYTISATVSGLTGTGLVLQDNGGSNLSIPSNGTYSFSTKINAGGTYDVTVLTQPTGQTCTVTNPTGTANSNVTVTVTCVAITYTISASVTGLTGTGLVLQDNGGSNLSIPSNGTYTFSTQINAGGTYDVTVLTQPTGQTCTVTNPTGTANSNVTVTVTCVAITYTISATVSGLTGTGLVLQDNGGSNLSIPSNGTYTFSTQINAGGTYDVTVLTQPTGQTCTVTNPTGTANSNVTVTVTCVAITYTISATVSGLTGTGLVLQDNGGSNLSIPSNGTYSFSTQINAGGTYDVTVLTQPTGQTCTVTNPTGTANSNVTVTVTCVAITYTISASVTGLTGTGLVLQDNGGSNLSIPSNGTYTFSTQINAGGTYDVTVLTQPTGQTCTVPSPSGTANSNVTVPVTCTANYTISAAVSGLTGTGLVLQDNGGSNLSIPSNGTYAFSTTIPPGGSYDVTILTQPSGQSCTVSNPSGTANSNVTVTVGCSINQFTWQSGADTTDQQGTYGTKGKASSSNAPGARYGATTWTDSSGNLWLFGGFAYDSVDDANFTDDLWEYSGGQWTWVNGSNAIDQTGVYGTLGVAAGTNQPGARAYPVSWKDSSGNFWLFGGYGADSQGDYGALNDLWEYSKGEWIWQGGSNVNSQQGTYGTLGQGSSTNIPGARYSASGAVDSSGTFWLFGGVAIDSQASQGPINDLWKYSGGQWTWVSGSNIIQQTGIYSGTGSVPGAREGQNGWIDSSGNFWLFAGNGIDSAGNYGYLNDLWEYSAGQWTWLNGANVINQPASYGVEGEPSSLNVPGSREYSAGWLDLSGNFWMFGGVQEGDRFLTDLWKYSAGEWTWINGSQSTDIYGDYGTLGKTASTNLPGSRQLPQTWTDKSGNLWLFGGYGLAVSGAEGSLSDLWEYQQ